MKAIIYEYGAELVAVVSSVLIFGFLGKMILADDNGLISAFIIAISNLSV